MTDDEKARESTIDELSRAISAALDVIWQWGSIDGTHHKQWCLDQVVRKLTLTEEGYNQWVKCFCYEWDEGTPP